MFFFTLRVIDSLKYGGLLRAILHFILNYLFQKLNFIITQSATAKGAGPIW